MDSIVDPSNEEFLRDGSDAIRGEIDAMIDLLAASQRPLSMPHGDQLAGTAFDLYELRWPPLSRGTGPSAMLGASIIRVLYGYARPIRDPTLGDVAVILLGGNKSRTVDTWYDAAVPEAERRLLEWCDEHLAFVPRESNE